ncbi:MAG: hypothetical protein AB7I18_12385 [Candidatus Berkiella sp.]
MGDMLKMGKKILICAFIGVLCGCQQMNEQRSKYVRDREKDYLVSTVNAPLRVPNDLSYLKGQEHYSFPDVVPGQVQPVSVVPPGFGELSQS